MQNEIAWTMFEEGQWRFILAATEKGLCYTGALNENEQQLIKWAKKKFPTYTVVKNDERLAYYSQAFLSYIRGEVKTLSVNCDTHGTAFQQAVWEALRAIPYGERTTYGQIAQRINNPKAVRAVGAAIGANPVMIVVPCHRVIGKNGKLTGFRGGLQLKEMLLHLEESH